MGWLSGLTDSIKGGSESSQQLHDVPLKQVGIDSPFGNMGWTEDDDGNFTLGSSGFASPATMNILQQMGSIGQTGLNLLPGYANPTADPRMAGYRAGGDIYGGYQGAQQASSLMPAFSQDPRMLANVRGGLGNLFNSLPQNLSVGGLNDEFKGLEGDMLGQLRAGVAKDNNFGASSKISSLINSGVLGTEGGARQIRGLDEAQRQQDLGFQLASKDFAMGQQNQYHNIMNQGAATQLGTLSGMAGFEGDLFNRGVGLNELNATRAQQRMQNSMGLFDFSNQLDQQNLQNALGSIESENAVQNQFLNWWNAAMAGTTGVTNATRPITTTTSSTDNGWGSVLGGLGGMAEGFGFSDRRLKKNVDYVGKSIGGNKLYKFHYLWDADDAERQIGVMADEVPHAAIDTPSGFKAVDYSKVL